MAGSVAVSPTLHRSRGVIKVKAVLTADASGVVTASDLPEVFGRLVAFGFKPGAAGYGPVLTVKDKVSAASIFSYDVGTAQKFGNTTTGDTTGGTAEDLWTTGAAHGLSASDGIVFLSLTGNGSGGPTVGTEYFVVTGGSLAATTFQLSDTVAHAVAGTNIVNVGATDASASTWYKVGGMVAKYFRPTAIITTIAGAAVSAADTAPNVNRSLYVNGKLTIGATALGNLGTCEAYLVIDESGLGEPAVTV